MAENPFFTPEERALLNFTETVALISENDVPDSIYEAVSQYFTSAQIVKILIALITLNA